MSILVDTDVLIAVLRGYPEPSERLRSFMRRGPVFVSPVTIAEIFAGMRPAERDDTEALLGLFESAPLDSAGGRLAGEFVAKFGPSHSTALPDALIAATAIGLGVPLWTQNKRHFPMSELDLALE